MYPNPIEALEPRRLLTRFVIDSLADAPEADLATPDGEVTLREVIVAANTNAPFGDAPAGEADGDFLVFSGNPANRSLYITGGPFVITDDLLLDGTTKDITLDAEFRSGVIEIATSEAVTIEGINLTRGKVGDTTSGESGGNLNITGGGTVTLRDVIVRRGESRSPNQEAGGGGIYQVGGALFIEDCSFFRNLTGDFYLAGDGGAILAVDTNITISNTEFIENSAGFDGGAIDLDGGSLTITDSSFDGNSATGFSSMPGEGGAIRTGNGTLLSVTNSTFVDNASDAGGAIAAFGAEATIVDSEFRGNTGSGSSGFSGGSAVGATGVLSIDNSIFVDNANSTSGGAVHFAGVSLDFRNSLARNNASLTDGGGLSIVGGQAIVANSSFENNTAGVAVNTNVAFGGGIHVVGDATVEIIGVNVSRNFAPAGAGGVYVGRDADVTIESSTISGNTIDPTGVPPGIRETGGAGVAINHGTAFITNTFITNNEELTPSEFGGGGILNFGGNLNTLFVTIQTNISLTDGGGVSLHAGNPLIGTGDVTLARTIIRGNDADQGGGIYIGDGETAQVDFVQIRANDATSAGGGIFAGSGATMNMVRGNLVGNDVADGQVGFGGGGIYFTDGTLSMDDVRVFNNRVLGPSGSGGGLYFGGGTATLVDTQFSRNETGRSGGGIEVAGGTLTGDNLYLAFNLTGLDTDSAGPGNGGGIHTGDASASVFLESTDMVANRAANSGGGFWIHEDSSLTLVDGRYRGNRAFGSAAVQGGGGLYNDGGNVSIDGSVFSQNQAENGNGGGILNARNGSVLLADAVIRANRAGKNGAGIFNAATFTVVDSRIRDNRATGIGGGIYTSFGKMTDIDNDSNISRNTPDDLGGPGSYT